MLALAVSVPEMVGLMTVSYRQPEEPCPAFQWMRGSDCISALRHQIKIAL